MNRPIFQAADLYGDIEASPKQSMRDYVPGLVVALLATLAAGYLSDHYGAPLTLMALLVGLALNFLSGDRRLNAGLSFAARDLLRLAVVLIGVRITFGDIADLGIGTFALVLAILALTFLSGIAIARALGFSTAFGALAGGAVAICGGSAAMALAATLGEKRVSQADVTMVLVGISAVGATAMALYPPLASSLGFSDQAAGFLMGAAIHDVAQAVGAGTAFSPQAGEVATIVKLSRVAMLAPVLLIVAAMFRDGGAKAKTVGVPLFLIGFFVVAAINSAGVIPAQAAEIASKISGWLMAMAIAAAAIRSPMKDLLASGPKPLLVVTGASLVSLAASLAAAVLLFD